MATTDPIGDHLNTWREPVFTLAACEGGLKSRISEVNELRKLKISSSDWERYCTAVNQITKTILDGMKKFARDNFEGLIIHGYIRQGSSREGLKVDNGLEFDCLLLFEIEGLEFTEFPVFTKHGSEIIGMLKLQVDNAEDLCRRYPWLSKHGILQYHGYTNGYFINTKYLQEKVFKTIVDRTCLIINNQTGTFPGLRRSAYPPTFEFRISLDSNDIADIGNCYSKIAVPESVGFRNKPSLNIDIVPALLLRSDIVPDPYTAKLTYGFEYMECKIFAVMKWAKNLRETEIIQQHDHEYLWRESTCGYEKHILDIARRNPSQRFLMTACRILKTYVDYTINNQPYSNQLHRVAVSYYMKNLCFHCIALLTTPSDNNKLTGVKEALGYLLCFLDLCIKNKNLPHFFYGNPWMSALFPNCSVGVGKCKKNLYAFISSDTFIQARRSFNIMMQDLKGLYTEIKFLDEDCVGRFKELLDLPHTYKKPKPSMEKRYCNTSSPSVDKRCCSGMTFCLCLALIVAVTAVWIAMSSKTSVYFR